MATETAKRRVAAVLFNRLIDQQVALGKLERGDTLGTLILLWELTDTQKANIMANQLPQIRAARLADKTIFTDQHAEADQKADADVAEIDSQLGG